MPCALRSFQPFSRQEDGTAYQVWKLETTSGSYVLKEISRNEQTVYQTFLADCPCVPKVFGFAREQEKLYMLMEFVQGKSLCKCSRPRLKLALDALISIQKPYWGNTELAEVGYGYAQGYAGRCRRLAYLGDLSAQYSAYLDVFSAVPRTLCNDDLLPFNVLVGEDRAVILDWEYAGILPYPCALARLLAFGEENTDGLFQMSEADRRFALDYYYEQLVKDRGISRSEYNHTMKLFFFHEYSEWIYCAVLNGDTRMANYIKYAPMARRLAQELSDGARQSGEPEVSHLSAQNNCK